jgi:hypothetical protein
MSGSESLSVISLFFHFSFTILLLLTFLPITMGSTFSVRSNDSSLLLGCNIPVLTNSLQSLSETSTSIMADSLHPSDAMPNKVGIVSAQTPITHEPGSTEDGTNSSAGVGEGESMPEVLASDILSTEDNLNHSDAKHESTEPPSTSPATSDHEIVLPAVAPVTTTETSVDTPVSPAKDANHHELSSDSRFNPLPPTGTNKNTITEATTDTFHQVHQSTVSHLLHQPQLNLATPQIQTARVKTEPDSSQKNASEQVELDRQQVSDVVSTAIVPRSSQEPHFSFQRPWYYYIY